MPAKKQTQKLHLVQNPLFFIKKDWKFSSIAACARQYWTIGKIGQDGQNWDKMVEMDKIGKQYLDELDETCKIQVIGQKLDK